MLKHLPAEIGIDNYREVINKRFVYVGIAEDLQTSVDAMARQLGKEPWEVERRNVSKRDEQIPQELKEIFVAKHELEYAVYQYAREVYRHPLTEGEDAGSSRPG